MICLSRLPGILICLSLIMAGGCPAFAADCARGELLRQYEQALNLYKSHRQLFQQNLTNAGSGGSVQSRGAVLPASLQLPRMRLPDDSPFANMAQRDFQLTTKEERLSQATNDLFASVNKISEQEFADTWKDLMSQALSCEQEIMAFNNELTSAHTDTSRKLTQLIHACDRDGIATEFQSTYQQFNNTSRVENELFRRADIHSKTICAIKMVLAQNAPKAAVLQAPAAPAAGAIDESDGFSRLDIVAQQAQLDREYARVTSLFAQMERLGGQPQH